MSANPRSQSAGKKTGSSNNRRTELQPARVGIIGGSGLYGLDGFENQRWVNVKTPFGAPSDSILTGDLHGRPVAFLPRHGRGHRIPPHQLNHRANIFAMKSLGTEWIISVSAVGSLQKKYRPRDVVLVDQFVDRTKKSSEHTFFSGGIVVHVAFAEPVCGLLRALLLESARTCAGARIHDGGTYVNMEGPAFSTRAESERNHRDGHAVIGMTNIGEARCAREAEIAYSTLAMVTDYDAWNVDEDHVTVDLVLENLRLNAALAREIVVKTIPRIPATADWPSHHSLKTAILTEKRQWPAKIAAELKPILKKYL